MVRIFLFSDVAHCVRPSNRERSAAVLKTRDLDHLASVREASRSIVDAVSARAANWSLLNTM